MYLSNNYVDINIYPLTMNVMRLWACLYGKGAISNDNIIIITILFAGRYTQQGPSQQGDWASVGHQNSQKSQKSHIRT